MGEKTTHINIYARVGKNSGVRGVSWDVSVELVIIPVPLDGVQLLTCHPVLAAHRNISTHFCSKVSSVLVLQDDNAPLI